MWAYIAGLFDGDGSFSIYRTTPSRTSASYSITLAARIVSCKPNMFQPMIDFLVEQSILNPKNKNWAKAGKKTYQLNIYSNIEAFIRGMYPYLLLKKSHADIVLKAIKKKQELRQKGWGSIVDNIAFFDGCRHELHKLRVKGPKTLKPWD